MNVLDIDMSGNKLDAMLLCDGAPDKKLCRKAPDTPESWYNRDMAVSCRHTGNGEAARTQRPLRVSEVDSPPYLLESAKHRLNGIRDR